MSRRRVAGIAIMGLAVGVASWWFILGPGHAEPAFDFGDGPATAVQTRQRLDERADLIATNTDIQYVASHTDNVYSLITAISDNDPDGWYRFGAASKDAYSVALRDHGVVIARLDEHSECWMTYIGLDGTRSYAHGMAPCDPTLQIGTTWATHW